MADTTEHPGPTSDAADLKARIEAERTGQAFVYYKDADTRQQILLLDPDADRISIGRRGDQDIVLHWDKQVSRAHALLERLGGDWTLIDELSQNGSYVNGDRVNKRTRLAHKDVMCFGATRITFQDRTSAEQIDSTARASEETWAPMTPRDRDVLRALCRPLIDDSSALPASNEDIAAEVALSVDSVKSRLRAQYERYGLVDLRQGEKRTRLARLLLSNGTFKPHDF
jgi:pSer/pThr/pTyr-binding forkhead associated (FHA) protein